MQRPAGPGRDPVERARRRVLSRRCDGECSSPASWTTMPMSAARAWPAVATGSASCAADGSSRRPGRCWASKSMSPLQPRFGYQRCSAEVVPGHVEPAGWLQVPHVGPVLYQTRRCSGASSTRSAPTCRSPRAPRSPACASAVAGSGSPDRRRPGRCRSLPRPSASRASGSACPRSRPEPRSRAMSADDWNPQQIVLPLAVDHSRLRPGPGSSCEVVPTITGSRRQTPRRTTKASVTSGRPSPPWTRRRHSVIAESALPTRKVDGVGGASVCAPADTVGARKQIDPCRYGPADVTVRVRRSTSAGRRGHCGC